MQGHQNIGRCEHISSPFQILLKISEKLVVINPYLLNLSWDKGHFSSEMSRSHLCVQTDPSHPAPFSRTCEAAVHMQSSQVTSDLPWNSDKVIGKMTHTESMVRPPRIPAQMFVVHNRNDLYVVRIWCINWVVASPSPEHKPCTKPNYHYFCLRLWKKQGGTTDSLRHQHRSPIFAI